MHSNLFYVCVQTCKINAQIERDIEWGKSILLLMQFSSKSTKFNNNKTYMCNFKIMQLLKRTKTKIINLRSKKKKFKPYFGNYFFSKTVVKYFKFYSIELKLLSFILFKIIILQHKHQHKQVFYYNKRFISKKHYIQ